MANGARLTLLCRKVNLKIMLTRKEFRLKYPDNNYFGEYAPLLYVGAVNLYECFLQFDETAACLGGPFEGNHGYVQIVDLSWAISFLRNSKNRKLLELWHEQNEDLIKRNLEHLIDYKPTLEKPISVKIYGNDDCSYKKIYATQKEAYEEVKFFEKFEPLDFNDVISFGFVFDN